MCRNKTVLLPDREKDFGAGQETQTRMQFDESFKFYFWKKE